MGHNFGSRSPMEVGLSAKEASKSVHVTYVKISSMHCKAQNRESGFGPIAQPVSQGVFRAWFSAHISGYRYQNEARPVPKDGYRCKAPTCIGSEGVVPPMPPGDALK